MRARRSTDDHGGTCRLCPGGAGRIDRGQQIALIPGYGWVHVKCALEARKVTAAAILEHPENQRELSGPAR